MTSKLIYIIILSSISLRAFSQDTEKWGIDYWKGKVLIGTNKCGFYQEQEEFEQDFGKGDKFVFNGTSIDNKKFSVSYFMQSTKKGCYICDIWANSNFKLRIDNAYIVPTSIKKKYTHILISLSGKSLLSLRYIQESGPHYLKFINLKKLNTITTTNPLVIYDGREVKYIDGSKLPNAATEDNAENLTFSHKSYKWQMLDNNKEWKDAPGKNTRYYYSPPLLRSNGENDSTYYFRRIAQYSQKVQSKRNIFSDSTAIATVVVKATKKPSLELYRYICEDEETIKLQFTGNLEGCNPMEKYNITINDGNKDTIFKKIKSGGFLELSYIGLSPRTYKIVNISSSTGQYKKIYSPGEEPSIKVTKHRKIKTHIIQREK